MQDYGAMAAPGSNQPDSRRMTNGSSTSGILLANLASYCTSPPIEVVVFGWGVTEDGQLGLDSKDDVSRPSVIESLLGTSFSGVQFNRRPIVAGSRQTLAVTEDGRVLSWGWNDRGTLGLGHRHTTSKPAVIRALGHEHVVQVAAGGWHCLAVTKSGQIYAWGGNEYFQCGVDAGKRDLCVPKLTVPFLEVSMVSCGGMHSVALTTGGDVWQWGEPWGDFSMEVNRAPRKLLASNVTSISSGAFHNLALNSSNQLLSWGTNDFGQLGSGDTVYGSQPRPVVGLDDVDIADISAGGWHSLCLTAQGEVYVWGRGEYGRLGLSEPKGTSHVRPCLVPGMRGHRVIQAACGGSHTMALTDEGRMFIWGRCNNGRQGFEAADTVEAPHEIKLPGGSERWHPICIAVGGRHSMCMALPRQTVDDHARRLTAASEDLAWTDRRFTGSLASPGSAAGGQRTATPERPTRASQLSSFSRRRSSSNPALTSLLSRSLSQEASHAEPEPNNSRARDMTFMVPPDPGPPSFPPIDIVSDGYFDSDRSSRPSAPFDAGRSGPGAQPAPVPVAAGAPFSIGVEEARVPEEGSRELSAPSGADSESSSTFAQGSPTQEASVARRLQDSSLPPGVVLPEEDVLLRGLASHQPAEGVTGDPLTPRLGMHAAVAQDMLTGTGGGSDAALGSHAISGGEHALRKQGAAAGGGYKAASREESPRRQNSGLMAVGTPFPHGMDDVVGGDSDEEVDVLGQARSLSKHNHHLAHS